VAATLRGMDVAMIVPPHGRPFVGREMVSAFLYWIDSLECGLDLLCPEDYRLPRQGRDRFSARGCAALCKAHAPGYRGAFPVAAEMSCAAFPTFFV